MNTDIADRIYKQYENKREGNRGYLGASEIGKECKRELWYNFRNALTVKHEGRLLKLFNRGNIEEDVFIEELQSIGLQVTQYDVDGEQVRFTDLDGHLSGGCDGIMSGLDDSDEEYICEFKTHNDKSFKDLVKKKVEKSKPQHFVQMQMYMGMSGLKKALYLAVNKNDDTLYAEIIEYDEFVYNEHMDKAKSIIERSMAPVRLSEDSAWYQCKWCNFHSICHEGQIPNKNCKTCKHSIATKDKTWTCLRCDEVIPEEVIDKGCSKHIYIPSLIKASVDQDDDDAVIYSLGKNVFANVIDTAEPWDDEFKDIPIFTSDEMNKVGSARAIVDGAQLGIKEL